MSDFGCLECVRGFKVIHPQRTPRILFSSIYGAVILRCFLVILRQLRDLHAVASPTQINTYRAGGVTVPFNLEVGHGCVSAEGLEADATGEGLRAE